MFLGILEVTKETEDMFVFHLPTETWIQVDVKAGPINLASQFSKDKTMRLNLDKDKSGHASTTDLNDELVSVRSKAARTERAGHDKLSDADTQHEGAGVASTGNLRVERPSKDLLNSKPQRYSKSVPRMSQGSVNGSTKDGKGLDRVLSSKRTFGIIPTLTVEMKQAKRKEIIAQLKLSKNKESDAERFLKNTKMQESPTSMQMKNTFLLQNTNSSFDHYAAQMKKRRMGNTVGGATTLGNSINESRDGRFGGTIGQHEFVEDESTVKINKLVPQARDGHSSIVHDGMLIVFGGDRHHMPFNDLFILDLEDFFFADY